ncbi:DVU_1551 family NTP transferase [Halodesulfovibrio sp.]|uniref:DVU_1551 family NTP transferase n=1 Tax=Halodesulfovibrio sp. TaxID=1912772 RepID=UPI0025C2BA48|nr:NTP transferase domain-containing protein [Halodesulfovibrio sp.]
MHTAYAILLAAGYGSRMGQCKPTLPLGTSSALELLSQSFTRAGVTPIVVTGHAQENVEAECRRLSLVSVHNPAFDDGMFSSVQAGCKALPDDTEYFFITPVDIPLIRHQTISALLTNAGQKSATVLHPVLDDSPLTPLPKFMYETEAKRGHPPCMHASLKQEILAYSGEGGLAGLLAHHAKTTSYIPVTDSGMLQDMDTPDDYQKLCELEKLQQLPSTQECYALWNAENLPSHIRKHSIAVTDVARAILPHLPDTTPLFEQTVLSGTMLHDIAKGSPKHASKGAEIVSEYGFPELASCIAAHSHLQVSSGAVTPEELVFLADKFIEGTTVCSLERRYEEKMACYASSAEVVEAIKQKLSQAQAIQHKVEAAINTTLDTLLNTNRRH